jgi:hypothetical protein
MNKVFRTSPLLGTLAALLTLVGCQTVTHTGATKAVCSVFPPITYSSKDTPETVTQIRRHNAGFDSYCK